MNGWINGKLHQMILISVILTDSRCSLANISSCGDAETFLHMPVCTETMAPSPPSSP